MDSGEIDGCSVRAEWRGGKGEAMPQETRGCGFKIMHQKAPFE